MKKNLFVFTGKIMVTFPKSGNGGTFVWIESSYSANIA